MFFSLLTALALVFVIEGILPFLSPQFWRQGMLRMMKQDDRKIRLLGFCSMIGGAILMVLVHSGVL